MTLGVQGDGDSRLPEPLGGVGLDRRDPRIGEILDELLERV